MYIYNDDLLLLENQTQRYQSQDENKHERGRDPHTDRVLLITARVVKLLRCDIRTLSRSKNSARLGYKRF